MGAVTTMGYMFAEATAFNQDISQWEVGQVTNMARMFRRAPSFNHDLNGWDVINVRDMNDLINFIFLTGNTLIGLQIIAS